MHFTGRVRLAAEPQPAPQPTRRRSGRRGAVVGTTTIYRVYFHGPAYQVLDAGLTQRRRGRSASWPSDLPPNHRPPAGATQTSPRLIELCFQTAGVWELGTRRADGAAHARGPRHAASPAPTRPAGSPPWSGRAGRRGIDADVVDERRRGAHPARGLPHDALPGAARRRRARAAAAPCVKGMPA